MKKNLCHRSAINIIPFKNTNLSSSVMQKKLQRKLGEDRRGSLDLIFLTYMCRREYFLIQKDFSDFV